MKVILLQDVKNVGKKGDVVDVSDGHARNMLFPKKLAAPATEGVVKARDKEISDQAKKKSRELEHARQLADTLASKEIEVGVRVGKDGKLFGSVTSQDVAAAIKKAFNHEIDKRKIVLSDPIKSLGVHPVTVKLYPEVNAKVNLKVVEAHGA